MKEHHYCDCDGCNANIKIVTHEGFAAGSFKMDSGLPAAAATEQLKSQMDELARILRKQGAWIGHIKASIQRGDYLATLSLTKDEVNVQSREGLETGKTYIHFASIITRIKADQLEKLLHDLYHTLEYQEEAV